MKLLPLFLFLIVSCGNPFGSKTKLSFRDITGEERAALIARELKAQNDRLQFLKDKKDAADEIVRMGNAGFEEVKPLLTKKCFDCHDANTKLRFYGRIFPGLNPIAQHQIQGIKALDFSGGYPLKAQGNPPQLALLKAIKDAVTDRSMPLRIYTAVYRNRRIFEEDQKRILAWVDPLITKIEEYSEKFETTTNPETLAKNLLETRCFRCHANGNSNGNFGDMEKTSVLLSSKFVDLVHPENSKMLNEIEDGSMPPSRRQRFTSEEFQLVRDWLILETKKPR